MNDDLNRFTKKFTDVKIGEAILNRDIYYLASPELMNIKNQINENPFSLGIPLGTRGNPFKPSAHLLEMLSETSTNKIFVNSKAEWLFLCERDIFAGSIIKNTSKGKMFLVQNERDENLGLGKKIDKGNKTIIKNVFDRGDFLRRER